MNEADQIVICWFGLATIVIVIILAVANWSHKQSAGPHFATSITHIEEAEHRNKERDSEYGCGLRIGISGILVFLVIIIATIIASRGSP